MEVPVAAEPCPEAGHRYPDPERGPQQGRRLGSFQLGIEEGRHQAGCGHHQAQHGYLAAAVQPAPGQPPAAHDQTPVPAQPQRDPQRNTHHARPGQDVEMRVVWAAQIVGPGIEHTHLQGEVLAEAGPADETFVLRLLLQDA